MHIFKDEIKSTRTSRKKLTVRLRQLQRFVLWHYVLLLLSATNSLFMLFVALNTDTSYQGVMFVFSFASLGIACYLLFTGLSTK